MLLQSLPSPELARWVDTLWLFEGQAKPHRVLPDGCIDFLVDLDSGRGSVAGPMTTAELVSPQPGARLFGVRFRPGVAPLLLETSADALQDQHVALDEVAPRAVTLFAERVAEARGAAERCAAVELLLRERRRVFDVRVHRAVALLDARRGALAIDEVASRCGLGARQLERLFRERVGFGPRLYARIGRMSRAVALGETHSGTQAALAARAGYSDEPHLLREFKKLTGVTPLALRAERHVGIVQGGSAPLT